MSDGFNKVILLGNLGQDPELRHTQSGKAVLNMRIATTESYKDRDGNRQERTDWHTVIIWGARAEGLGKFLRKGMRIFVEGSLKTSSFEDKNGQKRWKTEVNAREIIPTDSKGGRSGGNGPRGGDAGGAPSFDAPADAFGDDDDSDVPF